MVITLEAYHYTIFLKNYEMESTLTAMIDIIA